MEEVARLLRHVGRLPDQTDTESSMMFIAAKPATARHLVSQLAWRASSVSARSGCERMRAIADIFAAPR